MRREKRKILPLELIEKIIMVCDPENYGSVPHSAIVEKLKKFVSQKSEIIGDKLYYNFKGGKTLNDSSIGRALKVTRTTDNCGASPELRDLLSYFAYGKSFEKMQKEKGWEQKERELVIKKPRTDIPKETFEIQDLEEDRGGKNEILNSDIKKKGAVTWLKISLTIFFATVSIVFIYFFFIYQTPIFNNPRSFNILILPFHNPDGKKLSELGSELEKGLQQKNVLNNLGLEIKYLDSYSGDITQELAKEIGKKTKGTNLVIWGNDSKPNRVESHEIYFNYVNIGEALYNNKIQGAGGTEKIEMERVVDITQGAIHLDIDDIIYWFLGSKFYLNGDYNNALNNFKKIENNKYQNRDMKLCIGNCNLMLKQFEKAKLQFEDILRIDSTDINAHVNLGGVLIEMKDSVDALNHTKIALELSPNNCSAHFNAAVLYQSWFKESEKAMAHLKKLIEFCPDHFMGHFYYGIILHTEFKDSLKAKEQYEIAIRINPNYPDVHYNYAKLIQYYLKDNIGAKEHYEKALALKPNSSEIRGSYALLLDIELRDSTAAKAQYEKTLETDPNSEKNLCNYANFLNYTLHDSINAKIQFEKALAINPLSAIAHFNYGILLMYDFNDHIEGKKHYLKSIEIDGSIKTDERDALFEMN